MSECWAISDGAAGNERQALALAACLKLPVRSLTLQSRPPWSWLAPRLLAGGRLALPPALRDVLAPPWPTLAIGCGRDAALFTRLLRRHSGGRCRTVQILDPRLDPRHWDVVIAPRHDRLRGPNVLTTLGSLHPLDDAWLDAGREAWSQLGELPSPRIGVLLGGPRRGIALDDDYARRLAGGLRARHRRDGGSMLVLVSRRTPVGLFRTVCAALEGIPGLHWGGDEDGLNPYPGVLGWAERLVVTPDSVNMLSEACAAGCAVHTLAPAALPDKLARFHAALRQQGLLRDLAADSPPRQTPLRETAAIAAELQRRLGLA